MPWKDWYLPVGLNLTGNDIDFKAKPWDSRCYREPKSYFLFTHSNWLSFSRFDFFFFRLQVLLDTDTARELCHEEKTSRVCDNSNNMDGTIIIIKMVIMIMRIMITILKAK